MRRYLVLAGWLFASVAFANTSTLRVGSQVLVVGDSAAKVVELLGKPTHKSHGKSPSAKNKAGRHKGRNQASADTAGEQWQYRHEGRLITVILVDGRVTSFRDEGR